MDVVVTRSASGTSTDFVEECIVDSKGALGSSWMLENSAIPFKLAYKKSLELKRIDGCGSHKTLGTHNFFRRAGVRGAANQRCECHERSLYRRSNHPCTCSSAWLANGCSFQGRSACHTRFSALSRIAVNNLGSRMRSPSPVTN